MADTTFVDYSTQTPIVSAWLNDVNTFTYKAKNTATGAVGRGGVTKIMSTVSIEDFGGKGDGTTDNLAPLYLALNALEASGGGVLLCEGSSYRFSGQIVWGDGSNSQQSTKYHRITLRGRGIGTGPEVSNTDANGATRFIYDGGSSSSVAVIYFSGPLHSIGLESIVLDANSKAGYGLIVNHCTQGHFKQVVILNHTQAGANLTTRSGFPAGCAYGNADNIYEQLYVYSPTSNAQDGIIITSGVAGGTTLVNHPDSARNIFVGGTIFYGGSTGTAGLRISGADNNNFYEMLCIPKSGNDGFGNFVYFTQWVGSTQFPLENVFINCSGTQQIGGSSGTGGNTFLPLPTSDGIIPPVNDANLRFFTHTGILGNMTVQAQDGSTGVPSITFAQETDSGWYRKGTASLALSVSGTDQLVITTSTVQTNAAVDGRGFTGYSGAQHIFSTVRNGSDTNTSVYGKNLFYTGATTGPATGTLRLQLEVAGVSLLGAVGSYGGGVDVVFMQNATTVPTSNPTGGGLLYVQAGALKYRGSGGTITTLGAA